MREGQVMTEYGLFWKATGALVREAEGVGMIACDADDYAMEGRKLAKQSRGLVFLARVCEACSQWPAEVDGEGRAIEGRCVACQTEREALEWAEKRQEQPVRLSGIAAWRRWGAWAAFTASVVVSRAWPFSSAQSSGARWGKA